MITKKKTTRNKNFGIPEVNMTPIGTHNMALRLYESLITTPQRTVGLKMAAISFGFIFLTLGIFSLAITFWAFQSFGLLSDKIFQGLLGIPLGLIFVAMSLKIIYINLRSL